MSRTFVGFAFLLIAAAIPCACLRAEEPAKQGGAASSQTKITSGVLPMGPGGTPIGVGTLEESVAVSVAER